SRRPATETSLGSGSCSVSYGMVWDYLTRARCERCSAACRDVGGHSQGVGQGSGMPPEPRTARAAPKAHPEVSRAYAASRYQGTLRPAEDPKCVIKVAFTPPPGSSAAVRAPAAMTEAIDGAATSAVVDLMAAYGVAVRARGSQAPAGSAGLAALGLVSFTGRG